MRQIFLDRTFLDVFRHQVVDRQGGVVGVDSSGESSLCERVSELQERRGAAIDQVFAFHRADCNGLRIEGRVVRHCVFECSGFQVIRFQASSVTTVLHRWLKGRDRTDALT